MLARDSVVDRLGDLADNLAWKVTVETGDQSGGNDAAGFDLVG